jgi:hypothetical protein
MYTGNVKNAEISLDRSMESCLELKTDKTIHMFVSLQ